MSKLYKTAFMIFLLWSSVKKTVKVPLLALHLYLDQFVSILYNWGMDQQLFFLRSRFGKFAKTGMLTVKNPLQTWLRTRISNNDRELKLCYENKLVRGRCTRKYSQRMTLLGLWLLTLSLMARDVLLSTELILQSILLLFTAVCRLMARSSRSSNANDKLR